MIRRRFRPNGLANRVHHLVNSQLQNLADRVGFEPTQPFGFASFQDWCNSRSAIYPFSLDAQAGIEPAYYSALQAGA